MNHYQGTNNPSSYESFVEVSDLPDQRLHVFMNNPLKHHYLTFYQSSYFPMGPEVYGSIFTVNFDPGRFIKYLGSFLLVFGTIWHYYINRQKPVA